MSREKELRRILEEILEAPYSVKCPQYRSVILYKELERKAQRALSRPQRRIH